MSQVLRLRTEVKIEGETFRANVSQVLRLRTEVKIEGVIFRANVPQVLRLRIFYGLTEFSRQIRQIRQIIESGIWPAARNPPSSRRGLG